MADIQSTNNNKNPEKIDLANGLESEKNPDVKRIELAPLPEGIEDFSLDTELLKPRERVDEALEEAQGNQELAAPGSIVAVSQDRKREEERYRQVEKFLSSGLEDMYLSMDPLTRKKFKQEGEQAARTISDLLSKGRATAKRIVEIIRKWLMIIPGVNKFFLEQEAKIRADKIMNSQMQQEI